MIRFSLARQFPIFALVVSGPASADIWYVRAGASGANDGVSWADAFVNLQSALAAADSGDVIRVAAGTYKPAPPGGSQTATFQLESGVHIFGGFAGSGPDPDARDPLVNLTVLSGDLNGDGSTRSFHVVTGSGAAATARLDGFTITMGNADSSAFNSNVGGGIYIVAGSPWIENCLITGNVPGRTLTIPFGGGGGVFCSGGSPTLSHCVVTGNDAGRLGINSRPGHGGGIWAENGASLQIIGCTIEGTARAKGGSTPL